MFEGWDESFGTVPKGMKLDTKITVEAGNDYSPSVGTKFISPVEQVEEEEEEEEEEVYSPTVSSYPARHHVSKPYEHS